MKSIITILIFIYPLLFFAQNQTTPKIYVDVNLGLLPVEGEDFHHGLNISAGYRISEYFALGAALNRTGIATLYTNRTISGLSLEPRFTYKRIHLKLNGGIVLDAKYSDEYCGGSKTNSTNFYFRPAIEYRLGFVTFGLSAAFSPNITVVLNNLNDNNPVGVCTENEEYSWSSYSSRFVFFSVGLSFPKFKRKEK